MRILEIVRSTESESSMIAFLVSAGEKNKSYVVVRLIEGGETSWEIEDGYPENPEALIKTLDFALNAKAV